MDIDLFVEPVPRGKPIPKLNKCKALGQKSTERKNKESILAKHVKETTESEFYAFDLNKIDHSGNGKDGQPRCIDHIRTGPYFLLMGITMSQQKPVNKSAMATIKRPFSIVGRLSLALPFSLI